MARSDLVSRERAGQVGRPRKLQQVISGLRRYLDAAAIDPTMPLELAKIARRLGDGAATEKGGGGKGVSDDTIRNYANDPDVAAQLRRRQALIDGRAQERLDRAAQLAAERAVAAPATAPAPGGDRAAPQADVRPTMDAARSPQAARAEALRGLSDNLLARRIAQEESRAGAAMQRFLSRRRRDRDVQDVARVVFELEEAVTQLQGLLGELRPLDQEYRRRERERRRAGQPSDAAGDFSAPAAFLGTLPLNVPETTEA